jgi:hypothetical protein
MQMQAISDHFLLYTEAIRSDGSAPQWKFMLQSVGGDERLAADDSELNSRLSRLELLAVVRGLEAAAGTSAGVFDASSVSGARTIGNGSVSASLFRFATATCGSASTMRCSTIRWNAATGGRMIAPASILPRPVRCLQQL